MTSLFLSAFAALALPQASAAPAIPVLDVQVPELAGTRTDPTCGNKPALAQQAFCIATTMAAMQGQADQFDAAFRSQGWMAADGRENLTIYVRRKDGGGCDAFQVLAFADETQGIAPAAPAYFALAAIPGDVCTTATPAAPAAQ